MMNNSTNPIGAENTGEYFPGQIHPVSPEVVAVSEAEKRVQEALVLDRMMSELPGDLDSHTADLITDANHRAAADYDIGNDETFREAVIADELGALRILQGEDADRTAHALGAQPDGPLEGALRDIAETRGQEAAMSVMDEIDNGSVGEAQDVAAEDTEKLSDSLFKTEVCESSNGERRTIVQLRTGEKIAFASIFESKEGLPSDVEVCEASAQGVIELAIKNGASEGLRNVSDNLAGRHIGPQEKAVLDMVGVSVFGRGKDAEGTNEEPLDSAEGLAEAALALAGDPAAKERMEALMRDYAENHKGVIVRPVEGVDGQFYFDRDPSVITNEVLEKAKPFQLVRKTKSYRIQGDGSVALYSGASMTRHNRDSMPTHFVPRETVHFTFNHPVVDHFAGSFDGAIFVAPLDKALEANGAPTTINGVDTYFDQSPEEPVVLPEAVMILPSEEEMSTPYEKSPDGKIFQVKTHGFTPEDIQKVIDGLSSGELKMRGSEYSYVKSDAFIDALCSKLGGYDGTVNLRNLKGRLVDGAAVMEAMKKDADVSIRDVVSNPASRYIPDLQKVTEERFSLDGILSKTTAEMLVHDTLIKQKKEVFVSEGSSMYLTEGNDAGIKDLVDELGARGGRHPGAVEESIENNRMSLLADEARYGAQLVRSLRNPDTSYTQLRSVVYDKSIPTVAPKDMFTQSSQGSMW